jgi:hypothetical protein
MRMHLFRCEAKRDKSCPPFRQAEVTSLSSHCGSGPAQRRGSGQRTDAVRDQTRCRALPDWRDSPVRHSKVAPDRMDILPYTLYGFLQGHFLKPLLCGVAGRAYVIPSP